MAIQNAFVLAGSGETTPLSSWRLHRAAQILQRHKQFGPHRKLDLEALLARSERMIEDSKTSAYHLRLWAATIASADHSSQ